MEKSKNWFDWFDQTDGNQVPWAVKYLSDKGCGVITTAGLIQWINEANANLNMKPQDLGFRKFRDNMRQAWKTDSKRKALGKKSSNFILKSSTRNQLKEIARLSNMSQYKALEALIEDAAYETKTVIEDIKKKLEQKKLTSTKNTRAAKTIEATTIKTMENEARKSELTIEFLNRKLKSLIFSEIKNRYILESLNMIDYEFTDSEFQDITKRNEAAIIQLNREMKDHLELSFLTENTTKQDQILSE